MPKWGKARVGEGRARMGSEVEEGGEEGDLAVAGREGEIEAGTFQPLFCRFPNLYLAHTTPFLWLTETL